MDCRKVASLLLGMSLLTACGSAASDWADVSRENTIDGYRTFLKHHPTDFRAQNASRAILHLQDDQAWADAQGASTIDGFRAYLKQYPDGEHATTASENILQRERSFAWSLLPSNKTPADLQAFLSRYPSGPEAQEARIELQSITAYRAEFAMSRQRLMADRRREQVARKLKEKSPDLIILEPDAQSDQFRLTSSPMSEQQVNQLCDRAAKVGQACWIVKAAS